MLTVATGWWCDLKCMVQLHRNKRPFRGHSLEAAFKYMWSITCEHCVDESFVWTDLNGYLMLLNVHLPIWDNSFGGCKAHASVGPSSSTTTVVDHCPWSRWHRMQRGGSLTDCNELFMRFKHVFKYRFPLWEYWAWGTKVGTARCPSNSHKNQRTRSTITSRKRGPKKP